MTTASGLHRFKGRKETTDTKRASVTGNGDGR